MLKKSRAKSNNSKPVSSTAATVERTPTGIFGFDKLIQGGLPKGSTTLITGAAGTGKTLFQLQFLWAGLEDGEKALFITLEESPDDIKADALQFGWDFEKYEKKGQFRVLAYEPFELSGLNMRLRDMIVSGGYTRIALDSTSLFGMYLKDDYKIRKGLYTIISAIKSTGCTALISAEITEDGKSLSRYGVEEFVVDGVIVLHGIRIGEGNFRSIQVAKMRRTKHADDVFPFEFTNAGIVVKQEI